MTITILMSTYNGERFLREQLDSIVGQTFADWKLVIRDDGSTDRTCEIVDDYLTDQRISLFEPSGVNLGPAQSFLTLLSAVDTSHFAFADQDDIWNADKLASGVKLLAQVDDPSTPCAVFTDASIIDEHGTQTHRSALATRRGARAESVTFGELVMQNVVIGSTLIGNAELARQASKLVGLEVPMHDWAVAVIAKGAGTLRYSATPTVRQRHHDTNATSPKRGPIERLRQTIDGGLSGWRQRMLSGPVELARGLTAAGPLREVESLKALSEVDPGAPDPDAISGLAAQGFRLNPWFRQRFLQL